MRRGPSAAPSPSSASSAATTGSRTSSAASSCSPDSPLKLELAVALAALGGAIRRARRPSDARDPLRRAYELAEACGAEPLAAAIRTELHATGARPRSAALSGPASLTASERRVADLAAAGQTNKQIAQELFVTPKTVEVHLSNAYRKLDISGRRELAGALGSRWPKPRGAVQGPPDADPSPARVRASDRTKGDP